MATASTPLAQGAPAPTPPPTPAATPTTGPEPGPAAKAYVEIATSLRTLFERVKP